MSVYSFHTAAVSTYGYVPKMGLFYEVFCVLRGICK